VSKEAEEAEKEKEEKEKEEKEKRTKRAERAYLQRASKGRADIERQVLCGKKTPNLTEPSRGMANKAKCSRE